MSIDRTSTKPGTTDAEVLPDAAPVILRCDAREGERPHGCTRLVLAHRAEAKGWISVLVDGAVLDLCRACTINGGTV